MTERPPAVMIDLVVELAHGGEIRMTDRLAISITREIRVPLDDLDGELDARARRSAAENGLEVVVAAARGALTTDELRSAVLR